MNVKMFNNNVDFFIFTTNKNYATRLKEFCTTIKSKDYWQKVIDLLQTNNIESNLRVAKDLGIDKVIEITDNDIDEDNEKMSSDFGIEYLGFSVKGGKYAVKLLLGGIMAEINNGKASSLSNREREVLELLARGMTNKDIANTLYLSEKTVKNHLNNIFKKIDVTDRTKAALFAVNNNIC